VNPPIPNAQYNRAASGSAADRLATVVRRRMFALLMEELAPSAGHRVLDVGATSDESYESSNYLEAWYPFPAQITATGIDDASHLEQRYPGVRFVPGDGRALPFEDRSFDLVHASAVIEHVGTREDQARFLAELWRVARLGVVLTTPNRWFPVELHTSLPLLHWLPDPTYRWVLRRIGLGFHAEVTNLNLLSGRDLRALGRVTEIPVEVRSVRLAGWPSNLVLIARRHDGNEAPPIAD